MGDLICRVRGYLIVGDRAWADMRGVDGYLRCGLCELNGTYKRRSMMKA